MLAKSEFIEVLEMFDNDLLGIVLILMTIGTFVTIIVSVVSISRTWNNLSQTRMNQALVKDLLNQGYSIDDIERLVYRGPRWSSQFKSLVRSAKNQVANFRRRHDHANQPMPPVKQSA